MYKFIIPIILIGTAIAGFIMKTGPFYTDVSGLQAQVNSYNEALNNAKSLQGQRDLLTTKYNTISLENLDKLQKLLPDNVDNIRLILEIGKIAQPYGMTLSDVKYNASASTSTPGAPSGIEQGNTINNSLNNNYGSLDLEFSTQGTYGNFLSFLNDLEHNLRIVDISSIEFSSDVGSASSSQQTDTSIYKYSFKIKTYWLKN